MRVICAGVLISAVIMFGGLSALAATTGPDGGARTPFEVVVAGYMFEVSGAAFRTVTVRGSNPDGYALQANGQDTPLRNGNTFTFSDPVAFFYLQLLGPLSRSAGPDDVPAEVTLTDQFSASAPGLTVTPMLVDFAPDPVVPLPGSAWGLLAGLGGLVALRRRKRQETRAPRNPRRKPDFSACRAQFLFRI